MFLVWLLVILPSLLSLYIFSSIMVPVCGLVDGEDCNGFVVIDLHEPYLSLHILNLFSVPALRLMRHVLTLCVFTNYYIQANKVFFISEKS